MKFTDLKSRSLLKEADRFDPDVSDDLFGRSFLRSMVKEAADYAKLGNVNQQASGFGYRQTKPSCSSSNNYHNGREGNRHSNSDRGGFSNYRGKGQISFTSSLCLWFNYSSYIGGRVHFSANFWHTLTNDPSIIRSVTEGFRIPFVSRLPFHLLSLICVWLLS